MNTIMNTFKHALGVFACGAVLALGTGAAAYGQDFHNHQKSEKRAVKRHQKEEKRNLKLHQREERERLGNSRDLREHQRAEREDLKQHQRNEKNALKHHQHVERHPRYAHARRSYGRGLHNHRY